MTEAASKALAELQRYATRHGFPFMAASELGAWVLYDDVMRALSAEPVAVEPSREVLLDKISDLERRVRNQRAIIRMRDLEERRRSPTD